MYKEKPLRLLQIIPKIYQIWRYLELNSTKYSIIHTLRKICQSNAQIWVNMVNVMNKKYGKLVIVSSKFTAKFGGYCRKLGKNMVDIGGYLADILEGV